MGLAANVNEIAPSPGFDTGSGLARRTAHGRDVSISHATFPHGYRSAPHAYEGEEISQLIEGELTVYLQGQKYELKAGDVIRIPRLAIHWKHNGGQTEAVMLELHNPPLGGTARCRCSIHSSAMTRRMARAVLSGLAEPIWLRATMRTAPTISSRLRRMIRFASPTAPGCGRGAQLRSPAGPRQRRQGAVARAGGAKAFGLLSRGR